MGRHCSYRLFIPRENLRSALLLIAGAAEDIAEGRTTLEFPDHEVSLPFTLEFGKESRIPFDGALRDHYFALSLYFPMDPVVEEYVKEWREDIRAEFPGEWEPTLDASGRVIEIEYDAESTAVECDGSCQYGICGCVNGGLMPPDEPDSMVCPDCGLIFDSRMDRDDHVEMLHRNVPFYSVESRYPELEPPPGHPAWDDPDEDEDAARLRLLAAALKRD